MQRKTNRNNRQMNVERWIVRLIEKNALKTISIESYVSFYNLFSVEMWVEGEGEREKFGVI